MHRHSYEAAKDCPISKKISTLVVNYALRTIIMGLPWLAWILAWASTLFIWWCCWCIYTCCWWIAGQLGKGLCCWWIALGPHTLLVLALGWPIIWSNIILGWPNTLRDLLNTLRDFLNLAHTWWDLGQCMMRFRATHITRFHTHHVMNPVHLPKHLMHFSTNHWKLLPKELVHLVLEIVLEIVHLVLEIVL